MLAIALWEDFKSSFALTHMFLVGTHLSGKPIFFKCPKPSFGFSIFKNSFSYNSFKSFQFLCFIKICMVFLASLYSISSTLNLDTFDFQFPSGLFFLQSFHQTAHLHCLYCNSFCRCYFLNYDKHFWGYVSVSQCTMGFLVNFSWKRFQRAKYKIIVFIRFFSLDFPVAKNKLIVR